MAAEQKTPVWKEGSVVAAIIVGIATVTAALVGAYVLFIAPQRALDVAIAATVTREAMLTKTAQASGAIPAGQTLTMTPTAGVVAAAHTTLVILPTITSVPTNTPVLATVTTVPNPTVTPTAIPTATVPPTPNPTAPANGPVTGVRNVAGQVPGEVPGLVVVAPVSLTSALDPRTKQRDVYAIDLVVGQVLTVTGKPNGTGTARVEIAPPGVATAATNAQYICDMAPLNNSCGGSTFTAATTGQYYVIVNARGELAAPYTLALAVSGQTAAAPVNGPVTGVRNVAGQVPGEVPGLAVVAPVSLTSALDTRTKQRDVYAIDLVAGQVLTVTGNLNGGVGVRLEIAQPGVATANNAQYICDIAIYDNGCSNRTFTAATQGRYYVIVNARGEGAAPYSLALAVR